MRLSCQSQGAPMLVGAPDVLLTTAPGALRTRHGAPRSVQGTCRETNAPRACYSFGGWIDVKCVECQRSHTVKTRGRHDVGQAGFAEHVYRGFVGFIAQSMGFK